MSSTNSQLEITKLRNARFKKFEEIKLSTEMGRPMVYSWDSIAVREEFNRFENYRIPEFDSEYEPNPSHFAYDMELHNFLHFDELLKVELEKNSKLIKILHQARDAGDDKKYGASLLTRDEHLWNAISIRWPEKKLANGAQSGLVIRNPWAEDFTYGVANYEDVIMFGGGGQGKTHTALAFMTMIYDHFIATKGGAACLYSTVSESKLETSSWSLVNTLQSQKHNYRYSLYGGRAQKSGDYTYRRFDDKKKKIEEGGLFRGLLLGNSTKDSKVIDKLTGAHGAQCKIYLLDEKQATAQAPLQAYPNIFAHPKYRWYIGSGNYEKDGDLLSVNVEPNAGWDSVDETTHTWEGTLKSLDDSLGRTSYVIHYNNDLSPAITDPEAAKKWPFLPNLKKKKQNYPTKESEESYGYKRFWVGFKFTKESDETQKLLTLQLLVDSNANQKQDFTTLVRIGSFDSAPASIDGNTLTTLNIGLDDAGYPMIAIHDILNLPKPTSDFKYYEETANGLEKAIKENGIASNNLIMDWTQRTQTLEELAKRGIVCHHLIYQQCLPSKPNEPNPQTKRIENPILMSVIPSLQGIFQKQTMIYAHEYIGDRITLGGICLRWFIERGRFRNLNHSSLVGKTPHTFEKEMLYRSFGNNNKRYKNKQIVVLDSKEEFKKKFKFSPDILDTLMQAMYMLFVIFKVHPDKKGLGTLRLDDGAGRKQKPIKVWEIRNQRF